MGRCRLGFAPDNARKKAAQKYIPNEEYKKTAKAQKNHQDFIGIDDDRGYSTKGWRG
jgi:hypothetical protein